jgi:DNA repair protein RecN (Recombination protein N)
MLTHLSIKNFKLLKELSIDFAHAMTVITGETGAGKSIIIDTLELVLGAKVDTTIVLKDADRCEITAIFDPSKHENILSWLAEKDLASENECLIKRIITKEGRSKISINDTPCSTQTVRELGAMLINIHGQHEQQNLLKPEKQREILDAFADNAELNAKLKKVHTDWFKAKKSLMSLENLNNNGTSKIDFLRYQLSELENLALDEDELPKLHNKHAMLCNAEELIATCGNIINTATDDEHTALAKHLHSFVTHLGKIKHQDAPIKTAIELFNNASIQISEASDTLRRHLDKIEVSQDQLEIIEARLNKIHEIARKHKIRPEEITALYKNLQEQLQQLETADIEVQKLQEAIGSLEKDYLAIAEQLSKRRSTAATKLNKLITAKIHELGMEAGQFAINFAPNPNNEPNSIGLERAEFFVTANKGHPLQPLNKVASGGELSRISLAIQTITAEKNITPVLIFDEVDVGIGGKTAAIVGQMLRQLAQNAQIICVTHLPQVAASGHNHFKVEKQNLQQSTSITIESLTMQKRIDEIARMLGGIDISTSARKHAKEMLGTV